MEKVKRSMRARFLRALPVLLFLAAAVISLMLSRWAAYVFGGVSVDYESDNVPAAAGAQESGNLVQSYRYYLDISPSMMGYLAPEGRMATVGQALLALVRDRGVDATYYTYADTVERVTEVEFFDYLEDTKAMADRYNRALMGESLAAAVQEIDPCRIFTDQYSDGQVFDPTGGRVNVIVTDLNFLKASDDLDGHKSLMDDFAGYLSIYVKDCNFCIYRIRSTHIGTQTDEYNPNDAQTTNRDGSFFIIVLAENDRICRQYIENLERIFEGEDIALTEKHQLWNDPVGNSHTISVDRDSEFFRSHTQRTGLHWDNLSFYNLPDNAVGFHMAYTEDDSWASLQLPVTRLSLLGYSDAEDNMVLSGITTRIKVYQNTLFGGWEEDTQFSGLVESMAYMRGYGSDWYLCFNMDLEKSPPTLDEFGDFWKLHRCVLLDVRFQLETPYYSVPAWVENINTDELPAENDYSEKIGITNFIQTLNTAKAGAYNSLPDSYQGYLGNLLILIDY